MFAAATLAGDLFGFVELVIAVGVGQAIEMTAALVEPQAVESPQQTLRAAEFGPAFGILDHDAFNRPFAVGSDRDPEQSFAALIAGVEATLRIGGQRNPASMDVLAIGMDMLDDETRCGRNVLRIKRIGVRAGRGTRTTGVIWDSPRAHTNLAALGGLLGRPFRIIKVRFVPTGGCRFLGQLPRLVGNDLHVLAVGGLDRKRKHERGRATGVPTLSRDHVLAGLQYARDVLPDRPRPIGAGTGRLAIDR